MLRRYQACTEVVKHAEVLSAFTGGCQDAQGLSSMGRELSACNWTVSMHGCRQQPCLQRGSFHEPISADFHFWILVVVLESLIMQRQGGAASASASHDQLNRYAA